MTKENFKKIIDIEISNSWVRTTLLLAAEDYANSVAIAELSNLIDTGKVITFHGPLKSAVISLKEYTDLTDKITAAIARLKGEGGGNGN
jgi:hypothetical protein